MLYCDYNYYICDKNNKWYGRIVCKQPIFGG